MSAHTPGPWEAGPHHDAEDCGPGLTVWTRNEMVAAVQYLGNGKRTAEANANLIAAAPDLLSVASHCRMLALRLVKGGLIQAEDIHQADIALAAADAAIAKTRGK